MGFHERFHESYQQHEKALQRKNIHSPKDFIKSIRKDRVRFFHEIDFLLQSSTQRFLDDFFSQNPKLLKNIVPFVADCGASVDHVGFEVLEPMELVRSGVFDMVDALNHHFSNDISIEGAVPFSASEAFQKRMGGSVEIMRVTFVTRGKKVLLELFDIQNNQDRVFMKMNDALKVPNPENLESLEDYLQWAQAPFLGVSESIYHVAVQARSQQAVYDIHDVLSEDNSGNYSLCYQAPVKNAGDQSTHIKLVNKETGKEMEFVHLGFDS